MRPSTAQWRAIQQNDQRADGDFFYGVTSTGIFCRPGCSSRQPLRDHVRIFKTTTAAMAAGFRPCKRCRPTGDAISTAAWVAEIKVIIDQHYAESLSLEELALRAHGAPFYLHHVFQQATGQTPLAYLQMVRLARARERLVRTDQPIKVVAVACGFRSAAYFSTVFKRVVGQTPRQFRRGNQSRNG